MYWKIACLLMRTGHLPSVDAVVLQMMPRGFGPNADDLVVGGPCFIDTGREELIGRLALPFLSRAEGFQMTDHVHARHNSGSARKERRLPQLPCCPCLRRARHAENGHPSRGSRRSRSQATSISCKAASVNACRPRRPALALASRSSTNTRSLSTRPSDTSGYSSCPL
jgi:hypothetical protein